MRSGHCSHCRKPRWALLSARPATGATGRRSLLPAAAGGSGFAFAELAVDDDSAPASRVRWARSDSPTPVSTRTKPVQLWQQGGRGCC